MMTDTISIPAVLALFSGAPGMWEILLILTAMLLLFGKRLPEVGRSLGRGLVEFKKGLKGVQDEVHQIDIEATRHADEAAKEQQVRQQQALSDDGPKADVVETKVADEQKTA